MIGRNEPCHCGSGKKYKKCCLELDKSVEPDVSGKLKFPLAEILPIVKSSLGAMHIMGGCKEPVRVIDVNLLNSDTLQIDFNPYSDNSIDIKAEISAIMSFLNGLFKGDAFENADFSYYSVRAFSNDEEELLSALTAVESANDIANGDSLGWLKSSLFWENTEDYRLGIAKKLISEIENGLRHAVVEVLLNKVGEDWWRICLDNKAGNHIKRTYQEQFGASTDDGSVLIKYTYVLGLKKIITTYWPDFKNLFHSKQGFEQSIDRLNEIRREEAHNRVISSKHLDELKLFHNVLLEGVSKQYPDVLSSYLVDNWRLKVKEIMMHHYRPSINTDELTTANPIVKLTLLRKGISSLIDYLKDMEIKLSSIVVPPQKYTLHQELVSQFATFRLLHEKQVKGIDEGSLSDIETAVQETDAFKKEMDEFSRKFLLSES